MGGGKEVTKVWLTPKQARLVTGLERYQLDWLRKTGKVQARKWGNMWLYDAGDLYRTNERARQVLNELADFCERTEGGHHFTEAFSYWMVLEKCGWIEVYRPVHRATGLLYDLRYYGAQLREEGQVLASYISELRAEFADDVI